MSWVLDREMTEPVASPYRVFLEYRYRALGASNGFRRLQEVLTETRGIPLLWLLLTLGSMLPSSFMRKQSDTRVPLDVSHMRKLKGPGKPVRSSSDGICEISDARSKLMRLQPFTKVRGKIKNQKLICGDFRPGLQK